MFIYGYRSIIFRVVLAGVLCIAAAFIDMYTLMAVVLFAIGFNLNIVDIKKIDVRADFINITRYFKLSEYEVKLWLKDIRTAVVTEKKYTGTRVDGSGRRGAHSYWQLEVTLHNGNIVNIELLGMLAFERKMLIRKLNELCSKNTLQVDSTL